MWVQAMGLIAAVIATALCAAVYVRMYKRELPEPMGVKRAVLPVAFGVIAIFFTVPMVVLWGLLIQGITGSSIRELVSSLALRSLIASFFLAGFTEELIKFLMFLIVIKVAKPKSVYEYGLLCAGVGLGFTGLEDTLYGMQDPATSLYRALFFAMHLLFGLLMGIQLGLAEYSRQQGRNDVGLHVLLAFLLPVLWHTLFDAATGLNAGLQSNDENVQVVAVIIAFTADAISIALQFVLLSWFKKRTREYCGMRLDTPGSSAGRHAHSVR